MRLETVPHFCWENYINMILNHMKTKLLLALGLSLFLATTSKADVFTDGDFEASAWTNVGSGDQDFAAPGIDAAVEGAETLRMTGQFDGLPNFNGANQDIGVDGTDFSVGDSCFISGLIGHQSGTQLTASTSAYLEISFLSTIGGAMSAGRSDEITSASTTDIYHELMTPIVTISSGTNAIRVSVVMTQDNNDNGVAWADNISLVSVPEPNSLIIVGLGLVGLMVQRRKT